MPDAAGSDTTLKRIRYRFRGIIQGVGFRPTVYRCAVAMGLTGFVRNERSVVVAEIQGPAARTGYFEERLLAALPRAARIDAVETEELAPAAGEEVFLIVASESSEFRFPPIPPDLALCPDCLAELMNPGDRRYLYPFISCTQCGPRYSIVEDTPFDRETTSMVDFPLCPECFAEYTNPMDRRFHAQTTACPRCGPTLSLVDARGQKISGDAVVGAIQALCSGAVVAVQGIGGFHLAADPTCGEAVHRIRRDKERVAKPLALMARDMAAIEEICLVDEASRRELLSPRAPILILPATEPYGLADVSRTSTFGVMLPYTPLHFLLFNHPESRPTYGLLIMTSGNRRGEPMITDPQEALEELRGIADLFLIHDRRILFRVDDSVTRPARGAGGARDIVQMRRSRGFVPELVRLGRPVKGTVLAVGGDLKNAPAIAREEDLYLAPYMGDLEEPRALEDFQVQVERLLALYRMSPDVVCYDPHPLYRSRDWALESAFDHKVPIQHHHAHILSVMAEHGLEECLGIAFDGTGWGPDETIWGGEFLHCRRDGYRRLGRIAPFPLPGGEGAVLHPARIILGILGPTAARLLPAPEAELVTAMIDRGVNTPMTSSAGRLYDAAAAALGLVDEVRYEGEAPMRLEGAAWRAWRSGGRRTSSGLLWLREGDPFELDPRPLMETLFARAEQADPADRALRFHVELSEAATHAALRMRELTGLASIALSGGVFQNALLRELLIPSLEQTGFVVHTNVTVPPGDGGLAVGQAWFSR
jgi:hydrogenase maturation protein HypF